MNNIKKNQAKLVSANTIRYPNTKTTLHHSMVMVED